MFCFCVCSSCVCLFVCVVFCLCNCLVCVGVCVLVLFV